MPAAPQRSFASGEITPDIHARVDLIKYATGLKTCRNTIIRSFGGSANRAGFSFVGETKTNTARVRLVPFYISSTLSFVLEFGNLYFRIIFNGDYVKDSTSVMTVTNITNADPGVLTYSGTDTLATGDEFLLYDLTGSIAPYLNNRLLKAGSVNTGTNTLNLLTPEGTNVNTTSYAAYSSSGGSVAKLKEEATPWTTADLENLSFAQRGSVMYVSVAGKELCEIQCGAESTAANEIDQWDLTFTRNRFGNVTVPSSVTLTAASAASPSNYQYCITAVDPSTGEESISGTGGNSRNVSVITVSGTSATITTSAAHGYTVGNWVRFANSTFLGTEGVGLLCGDFQIVSSAAADTFVIRIVSGSVSTVASVTNGITVQQVTQIVASDALSATNTVTVAWTIAPWVTGYVYNIYRATNGIFGLIGSQTAPVAGGASGSFVDTGFTPNTAIRPPINRVPQFTYLGTAINYPAAVGFMQQRFVMGGGNGAPESIEMSQPGAYFNNRISDPPADSDAVTFTPTSDIFNRVKHFLEVKRPLVFTDTTEYALTGADSGQITPAVINPKVVGTNGIGTLPPLKVNDTAIYVQARGDIIRDLFFENDDAKNNDLSLYSSHLIRGFVIKDWAYQKTPDSIVWMVRNDGVLIGMTYVREQGIIAFHRHDTDGFFENVVCVPEGTESAVYVVVRRTINGVIKRYVERMNSRTTNQYRYRFAVSSSTYDATTVAKPTSDIADLVFMDSALTYDGRLNKTAYEANSSATLTRMTLTTGAGWTTADTLTLTASAATFTSAAYDVGNAVIFYDADGLCLGRFTITGFTSTTVVTGTFSLTVPTALRATPTYEWVYAVDSVSGLWHLEGETVSVIADGFVIGSPNNSSVGTTYTVTNGQLTLDQPYGVIHVGMPYVSDLQTLNIDADGTSLLGKQKTANQVEVYLKESRGVWMGPRDPADDPNNTSDALLWNLVELRQRSNENYYEPVAPFTGTERVNILAEWNSNGRIFIRQVDPLPISVLAVLTDCQVSVPRG